MTTHAKLSPSSAKRWMTCPGSVQLIDSLDLGYSTSKFAAEGTVAHELCEECLLNNVDPTSFLGEKREADGFKFTVNDNMVEAVKVYVDYIRNQIDEGEFSEAQIKLGVEVKCSLKELGVEGMDGGTSDAVLIDTSGKYIEVVDYKHGQGVAVEIDDNYQLMSYALGALLKYSDDPEDAERWAIYMSIVQPRAFHPDGPIRTTKMNGEELMKWCYDELIPAGKAVYDDKPKFEPSDEGCRWCGASGQCPAQYNRTQEIALKDFDDCTEPKLPEVVQMTAEQKKFVMKNGKLIKSFIENVEKQVKLEVEKGSTDYEDSFKLVKKKTNRKFTDDALDSDFGILLDHLTHEQIFTSKPRTLAQIEKALKTEHGKDIAKEIMDEVTTKAEGELVIAPLSDKRKAAQPDLIGGFDNVE